MLSAGRISEGFPERLAELGTRDDFLASFFHLLWEKKPTDTQPEHQGIRIPDTIVVDHSRTMHWYFTSKDGSIKMKSKKNLTTAAVMEYVSEKRRASSSGAACWVIGRTEDSITMHAETATGLRRSLTDGNMTGLVQTFIDTKNPTSRSTVNNAVLVANWTPHVLYIERRVNINDQREDGAQKNLSLDDRTTVSGASRYVQIAPLVSSHISQLIEGLCQSVARHIESKGLNVTGLTLHVKTDHDNKPWLLCCSSMRIIRLTPNSKFETLTLSVVPQKHTVRGGRSRSAQPCTVRQAESVSSGDSRDGVRIIEQRRHGSKCSPGSPEMLVNPPVCSLCRVHASTEDVSGSWTFLARRHILFPLSVINFFASHPTGTVYREEAASVGDLPAEVRLLEPEMTRNEYSQSKNDAAWLDQRLPLCSSCSAALQSATANMRVESDGSIRVPSSSHPLSASSGKRRVSRSASHESRESHRANADGLPPLAPVPKKKGDRLTVEK